MINKFGNKVSRTFSQETGFGRFLHRLKYVAAVLLLAFSVYVFFTATSFTEKIMAALTAILIVLAVVYQIKSQYRKSDKLIHKLTVPLIAIVFLFSLWQVVQYHGAGGWPYWVAIAVTVVNAIAFFAIGKHYVKKGTWLLVRAVQKRRTRGNEATA